MSDFKAKMHKIHNSKFDFRWGCPDTAGGLTEIAGLDIDGRVKKRGWTLQDWTMADRTLTDGYLYHQKSNNEVYESFARIEFNAK